MKLKKLFWIFLKVQVGVTLILSSNSVNVKVADLQLGKLKSATRNVVGVTLRLSSN